MDAPPTPRPAASRHLLAALLWLLAGPLCAAQASYSWSVVPQFTPTAVHRDWTPLLRALEARTGYHFRLQLYESIPEFEKALADGRSDFAYMNPYHAVMFHRDPGYRPLIRDDASRLTGILVVRRDSPIHSVQELDGRPIAFASPNAFLVSLYMRALLREKEQIDFTPVYVVTHSNAYRQVLRGLLPACGGVYRTLRKERPEAQEALRVIYETPSTTTHPITAHPRVPETVQRRVQEAILALARSEEGRALLSAVLLPKPVAADYARDYEPLGRLNLERYVVPPR